MLCIVIRLRQHYTFISCAKVIQKVENVCAYCPSTCVVAADHWFLVFRVMLKNCLMHLYVGSCHIESADIAVAMAVPIENPAVCEVRGVIRFLQADEISPKRQALAWNCFVTR